MLEIKIGVFKKGQKPLALKSISFQGKYFWARI